MVPPAYLPLLWPAAAAFLLALATTRLLVWALAARGMLDTPNVRSSHTVPTPRGGGVGVLAGVLPAWTAAALAAGWAGWAAWWIALGGLVALAAVCWLDDRRGLPWRVRLLVQALAVGAGLLPFLLFPMALGVRGWPLAAGVGVLVLAGVLWLGFLNAFNFMDGIDGLAAVEAACIALGAALAMAWLGMVAAFVALALALAAAAAGFLVWNRPPARIFLGDVGSVPLGWLCGFLLVAIALEGAWGAALTLPAYFGADAVLTMARRWRRGARLTEAHREHAYQRAAGRDKAGHARVVRRVLRADLALIAAVALGLHVGGGWGQALTLALGALVVAGLLWELEGMARRRGDAP